MKVGDLVRWSEFERMYYVASSDFPCGKNLTEHRKRGIIIDKNNWKYFVFWEDGEIIAHADTDIEVISEAR